MKPLISLLVLVLKSSCYAAIIKLGKEIISTVPVDELQSSTESPLLGVMPGGDPLVRYHPFNWPQGIVKFAVHDKLDDSWLVLRLRQAMTQIEQASCLKFVAIEEPPEEGPWLNITNIFGTRECMHYPHVITATGEVQMELGYHCLKQGQLIHTLMHGLGFSDEVTHPQRDKYVRIMWTNIIPEYQHLFRIRDLNPDEELTEYDPNSVMQFHSRAFSRNGEAVMLPLTPSFVPKDFATLSMLDSLKLNMKFKHECNKRNVQNLMKECANIMYENNNIDNTTEPATSAEVKFDPTTVTVVTKEFDEDDSLQLKSK